MPGTWIKYVPGVHRCDFPDSKGGTAYGIGSVWQCDECQKVYTFQGWVNNWETMEQTAERLLWNQERYENRRRWWQW